MNKIYLELDERKARLFEYSKDPKDGFEKNEPENGKISYRKYHNDGIVGVLKFINEKDEEFKNGKVKKLTLVLDKGDLRQYINFNILTAKGNMNQFVEQFIPVMPNLKIGESYRIFPYEMPSTYKDKDGNEKTGTNKGVSVYTYDLDNDTKLLKVEKAHKFGAEGDIPAVKWEQVDDMGTIKNIKNDLERRNYLYAIFKKYVTQAPAAQAPAQESKPAPEPVKQEPVQAKKPEFSDEEHDDLPF